MTSEFSIFIKFYTAVKIEAILIANTCDLIVPDIQKTSTYVYITFYIPGQHCSSFKY